MITDYDQLALEVSRKLTSKKGFAYGERYAIEFARRYRVALREKMEPVAWQTSGGEVFVDWVIYEEDDPLYSLKDW